MRSKARRLLQNLRGRPLFTSQNPASQMDQSERYCFNPVLKWNPWVEEYFIKAYGAERFSRISTALTRPSCYSCIRVNTLKSTTDSVIEKLHVIAEEAGLGDSTDGVSLQGTCTVVDSDKPPHQNGLSTNANGFLGSLGDAVDPKKEGLLSSLISKCDIPGLDYVVFIRGSGPHDIDGYALDKPPKEVMVSRKCAEAVLRGAQVYVPGALACSAHVEKGDLVAVSVAVEQPVPGGGWGVNITRGTVLQGLETDPLYNERNRMYIGHGIAMMSRAGIFRASEGVAVDMKNRVYRLPSFNDVLPGKIFLQNLPSIITAHALDPQKGERILDMCAAPGGKTTAIAILMKDEGEIVAADRSHNKVLDIQKLAAELGLNCISTYKLDALKSVCKSHELAAMTSNSNDSFKSDAANQNSRKYESQIEKVQVDDIAGLSMREVCNVDGRNEKRSEKTYASRADIRKNMRRMRNGPGRNQCNSTKMESSKGFPPHSFDRVLLDAPCSALGLRPRLFSGEETIVSLRNHAKYQRRMFDQAVQLVRPGGVIVYSTCTINPGENEALVRYALDTYKFLSLAPQHPRVGGPGLVGSFAYSDGFIEEWLKPGEEELVQRFDPSAHLDTIGFFIAKFNVNKET